VKNRSNTIGNACAAVDDDVVVVAVVVDSAGGVGAMVRVEMSRIALSTKSFHADVSCGCRSTRAHARSSFSSSARERGALFVGVAVAVVAVAVDDALVIAVVS
jgi:hypothetical protein